MSWIRDALDTLGSALSPRAVAPAVTPPPAMTQRSDSFERALVRDAWQSSATGLGNPSFDRTRNVAFGQSLHLGPGTLEALYRENGIARKIIDLPIEDAVRPGYEVLVDNDEDMELEQAIRDAASRIPVFDGSLSPPLGLLAAVQICAQAADLYGGAVLVGLFDDGLDPSQPLGAFAQLEGVVVLDRWSCSPVRERGGSQVTAWMIGSTGGASQLQTGRQVHPSRVIPILGSRLTPALHSSTDGWGDSRLTRCFNVLARDGVAEQTVGHLAEEAVVGKYKIAGLGKLIADNGIEAIRSFLRVQALARSAFNAAVVDADNGDYVSDKIDFSGLVSILTAFPERVSAAADIPMMKLYGKSAPGMNATGETDLRGYYDVVDSRYRGEAGKLTTPLRRLHFWLLQGSAGPTAGEVIPHTLAWNPLWTPTPSEEADRRLKVAQADTLYIQAGVVTPEEVSESRFSGRVYSAEMALDVSGREAFAAAQIEAGQEAGGVELDPIQQIQQGRLALPILHDPYLGNWARAKLGAPAMTPEEERLAMERFKAEGPGTTPASTPGGSTSGAAQ